MPNILTLYDVLTRFSAPILTALLHRRQVMGKEDAARLGERMGVPGLPRPAGKLLWVHGASNGELIAALPLLRRLLDDRPDWQALVTSGTLSSAGTFARLAPTLPADRVRHQFIPLDHPQWVARFMAHWQPDAVMWMESELWPNLLRSIRQRRLPAILVNARMRPKSFRRWRMLPDLARDLLSTFDIVLAMASDMVPMFKTLGARDVQMIGNLKYANLPPAADPDALAALRQMIGTRLCLGAFSTHATDETLFAETCRTLRADHPDLLGIIALHHPTRSQAVFDELTQMGFHVAVRSRNDVITPDTDLYLADTRGEMGLWHHLCQLGMIGGSFFPFGGQNAFECLHAGCIPVYGPHMFNFTDMVHDMEQADVSIPVSTRDDLTAALRTALHDPTVLAEKRQRARAYAATKAHILDPIANLIEQRIMTP